MPSIQPISSSNPASGRQQVHGPQPVRSLIEHPAAFWAIALAASVQFAIVYVRTVALEFPFDRYAYADVEYPYRRRVLMQWVLRAALHFRRYLTYTSRNSSWGPVEICCVAVAVISLLACIAIARRWIRLLAGGRSGLEWLSLLVIWICNYHFLLAEIRFQLPYDLPSMAFFGLGCYAAYTRNRPLYYVALLVGTVNRESTLFLPLVFLLFSTSEAAPLLQTLRRIPLRLYAETLLQFALWAAIYLWCVRSTGGSRHLPSLLGVNARMILKPVHWTTYASIFGFLWIPYVAYFRRIGDARLQRLAWLAPLWAIIMFVFADPLEIRTHSEWAVYLVVCLACIARSFQALSGTGRAEPADPSQASPALGT